MFKFLTGVLVGWFLGSWYTGQGRGGTDLDRFRRKASAALDESARMVEESKRELQTAVSGRGRGRRANGGSGKSDD